MIKRGFFFNFIATVFVSLIKKISSSFLRFVSLSNHGLLNTLLRTCGIIDDQNCFITMFKRFANVNNFLHFFSEFLEY